MMDTLVNYFTSAASSPTLWVLVASLVVYFYTKYVSTINYWSSRGVAGPKPKFASGNFHEFLSAPFRDVFLKWTKEYGRFFGIWDANRPIIVTTDPELIKEVFIKNGHIFTDRRPMSGDRLNRMHLFAKRGDDWKSDRRIMSPSFTSGKMKAMFSLMFECYKKLEEELNRVSEANKEVDSKILFSKLTSTVIARCAFATVIDPYTDENDPLLKNLHGLFKVNKFRMIMLRFLPAWVKNIIGASTNPEASNYVRQVCRVIVKQRKDNVNSGNQDFSDLIQLLIDAGKEMIKDDTTPDHESHHGMENDPDAVKSMDTVINNNSSGKKTLSDDEIIANVVLFFLAGFETTSTLLHYASFVLTTQPQVQEKLYQELKAAYDKNNGHFDYETLTSHPYLDSFICETLRVYPPANAIERMLRDDYKLSNGFQLNKNDLVFVPLYTLHHDPEFYEKPEKFDIERFLPENRGKIAPCTYLPFGTGPRNCIGMRFALLEAKMALANMMMKFKFVATSKTTSELDFKPMAVVLTTKEPILIKVEKR